MRRDRMVWLGASAALHRKVRRSSIHSLRRTATREARRMRAVLETPVAKSSFRPLRPRSPFSFPSLLRHHLSLCHTCLETQNVNSNIAARLRLSGVLCGPQKLNSSPFLFILFIVASLFFCMLYTFQCCCSLHFSTGTKTPPVLLLFLFYFFIFYKGHRRAFLNNEPTAVEIKVDPLCAGEDAWLVTVEDNSHGYRKKKSKHNRPSVIATREAGENDRKSSCWAGRFDKSALKC